MTNPASLEPAMRAVIVAAMTAAGMTSADLTRATGLDIDALRIRLDRGGRFVLSEVCAIARALGVKPSTLIARAEGATT